MTKQQNEIQDQMSTLLNKNQCQIDHIRKEQQYIRKCLEE